MCTMYTATLSFGQREHPLKRLQLFRRFFGVLPALVSGTVATWVSQQLTPLPLYRRESQCHLFTYLRVNLIIWFYLLKTVQNSTVEYFAYLIDRKWKLIIPDALLPLARHWNEEHWNKWALKEVALGEGEGRDAALLGQDGERPSEPSSVHNREVWPTLIYNTSNVHALKLLLLKHHWSRHWDRFFPWSKGLFPPSYVLCISTFHA